MNRRPKLARFPLGNLEDIALTSPCAPPARALSEDV
jgi:hypothetical protein